MAVRKGDLLQGTLDLLVLKVLGAGPNHGYGIATRLHQLSDDVLHVEEGSLYPALQKILLKGWATAAWGTSETNRKVRFYTLTRVGVKQLEAEASQFDRQTKAIQAILRTA